MCLFTSFSYQQVEGKEESESEEEDEDDEAAEHAALPSIAAPQASAGAGRSKIAAHFVNWATSLADYVWVMQEVARCRGQLLIPFSAC